MRRCAAVVAVLALSLPPAAVVAREPADIGERVLACAPCHGATGEGSRDPYFPRLAGKPAGYLFNQLVAFRDGRRRFPPMNYLLEYLPSEYLKDIATYFADQHPPLPTLGPPDVSDEVLKQGQALVTQGDAGRAIPACSSCHGPNLTGMEPGIPGLLGLHPAYVSAQLGAWRYGTRTALAPDCMQGVAARLTEADVRALAAYLATLPAPLDSAPATQGAYALPFACGSESTR
jgi:cytochrome c553